jgi:hypothetical protein
MRRIFFSFFLLVITILMFINFVFTPVADLVVERHLAKQLDAYWEGLVRGTFHMVFVDLERVPQAQWDRHVDRLRDHFGYTIDLMLPSETGLSDAEQSRVMEGRLVVKNGGEIFFMRGGPIPLSPRHGADHRSGLGPGQHPYSLLDRPAPPDGRLDPDLGLAVLAQAPGHQHGRGSLR